MFDLPETVIIDGRDYAVRTDYRVILEIFVMLNDPDLTDGDKVEALMQMFYISRPDDTENALQAFADFTEPRKRVNGKRPRLLDWEEDFDLIAAGVNHVLGTECRALPYLHWRTFLAAFLEISPESLLCQVLNIRRKIKSGEKLEKWERRWYQKNRHLVDLPQKFSDKEKALLEEWT